MNREESLQYCKGILHDFIDEMLGGDIKGLCRFDIGTLSDSDKYGRPPEYHSTWSFDPDDSVLARCALYLVYCDEIGGLTFDDIGKGYRGDTLFTPGNLMGRSDSLILRNDKTFWSRQEISPSENGELCRKIDGFLKDYHTLSNMALFPNAAVCIMRRNMYSRRYEPHAETLNQYRGMNSPGFSDYMDVFLENIRENLCHMPTEDRDFQKLFSENGFYFDKYDNDFQRFIDSHFFGVFYENEDVFAGLSEQFCFRHLVRWRKAPDYAAEIEKFLTAFYKMSEYRAGKITNKLADVL